MRAIDMFGVLNSAAAESQGTSTLAIAGGAGALGLLALLATGVIKL
jgi:hypothetical protein